jgi:ParB-like chromosome segregation protein Spo0J
MSAAMRWQPQRLPEDVRRLAETAAAEAGLPLPIWLRRLIEESAAAESAASRPASAAAHKALTLLAENLRYDHFPPLDEARAYRRLTTEFGLSASDIATGVGRPAEQVTRALKLLGLPEKVQQLIERRALSPAHAYALIEAEDPEGLAEAVLALGLAVDETRARAARREPPRRETGS